MKNISNIIRLVLTFACAVSMLGSCSKDSGQGIVPNGNGELEVDMTFLTPLAPATRAPIAAEDELKDITLLVFEGKAATSKFLYSRYAWRTSTTANNFKTTLKLGDDLTIYFAANAKDLIKKLEDDGELVGGTTTWGVVRELLTLKTPTSFDLTAKGLPMWGHKFDVDIADKPNNSLGKVNLLRSVASVDIDVLATDFTLEKGHLVFAANKGYLAYSLSALEEVVAPVSPADMVTTVDWAKTVVAADGNKIGNYFYMYENDTDLTPTGTNRPTKVILEGKWTGVGASGKTTFYPLTFRDYNATTKEYDKKQVTRNNKYLIAVTKVNGDGWASLDDAKNADDVNMEYDVIDWNQNDDGEIIIDGPKYFYRAATEVFLGHKLGDMQEVVFRTNFTMADIKMTFDASGTAVAGPVSNDRFKAEAVTVNASQPGEYTCFRFTALKPYGVDSDNPSVLYVTVGGRLSFRFTVTQLDRQPDKWEDGGNSGVDL